MANNSVVTQEKLQEFYDTKVYPYLNGATHTGCVPVGSRLDGWFPTTPKYYLYCDGAEYLKSDYPELAELLAQVDEINSTAQYVGSDANHFKVPDVRGEFIRGTGTNSHTNQGSGAGVGVHQNGTSMGRVVVDGENSRLTSYASDSQIPILNTDQSYNTGSSSNTFLLASASKTGQTDTPNTYTTRPTNTSLPQYICYKTHYIDLALDSFPLGISNPTDGQALVWNGTEGRWKNAGILHEYSTDEHVVGTWIDGKPLYERVIVTTLNVLPAERTWYTITDLSNVDTYISLDGMISDFQVPGYFRTIPYSDVASNAFFSVAGFNASHEQFPGRIQLLARNINIGTVYITARYTKITD